METTISTAGKKYGLILESMVSWLKTHTYYILLLLLITVHLFGNVLWITLNNVPPTWDASLHTVLSIKFYEYVASHLTNFNFVDFLKISEYYPPFVHWVGAILAWVGGENYKVVSFSGTIFFLLAIAFQFLLVKSVTKNSRVAIFAAFFFSFFLTNYQQSRDHMLDIPLTALILLSLYFLQKQKILLFFLFAALAFLTKWYAIVYLFIPFLSFLLETSRERQLVSSTLIKLSLGMLLFLLVAAPWYSVNFARIFAITQKTSTAEFWNPQNLISLGNLFFHLKLIIMFQTTFAGFLLFLISVLLLLVTKFRPKIALFLIITIIFNYLVFTAVPNKNIRYLIPLTPFFAMVMGLGIERILHRKNVLFTMFGLLVIPYYFLTYTILSFGYPTYPDTKSTSNFALIGWVDTFYLHTYPVNLLYRTTIAPYSKILADVFSGSSGTVRVLILKDTVDLNNGTLDPYLYPVFKARWQDFNYVGYDLLESSVSENQIDNFLNKNVDFVLVAVSHPGLRDYIREYDSLIRFQQFFLQNKAGQFDLIKKYELPGNSYYPDDTLLLYKKRV
jgi:4-amino-4-deoxy-L-arabinose transferase-like glycosyltransferase